MLAGNDRGVRKHPTGVGEEVNRLGNSTDQTVDVVGRARTSPARSSPGGTVLLLAISLPFYVRDIRAVEVQFRPIEVAVATFPSFG